MLVKTHELVPLARLIKFLELGEKLAHDCAQAQISLAPEHRMKKFLSGQARQEKYHAGSFRWAIAWLAPRHVGHVPYLEPLEQYRSLLYAAIQRKDFVESLLAEQIILEGLGEVLLKKIEAGLIQRNAPFQGLRRMLIHQEEAHHAFGLRTIQCAMERQETSVHILYDRAQGYIQLAETMMTSVADLFYSLDEDPNEYIRGFYQQLPHWLRPPTQSEKGAAG